MNCTDVKFGARALAGLAISVCLWFSVPARGQEATPGPAKVVTRYALTSSHDLALHDPKSWRLLASNDQGRTWTVLDVRTNQLFEGRLQRRVFRISNHTAYNEYRLQVDEANSSPQEIFDQDTSVQLADLELMGSVVGANESDLQCNITASDAHPLMGPAENAFDNDPTTRWFDLGLWHRKECWIQCQYSLHSQLQVTNLGQMQLLMRLAGTSGSFLERGPSILSNLMARANAPRPTLVGYALTSANDEPDRDPRCWRLLGSNDGGRNWAVVDERTEEIFTSRFQRRIFALTNPAAYLMYRLRVDATRVPGNILQIAEIEPLSAKIEAPGRFSLVVSAAAENPPLEATARAFDGDPKTKWLSFRVLSPKEPSWIQWEFVPAEDELPVVDRHAIERLADQLLLARLTAPSMTPTRKLKGYALTSANDVPSRDPRDWRLLGSNDEGKTWTTLDSRRGETFASRGQRRVFTLAKEAAFASYRLQIDSVAEPARANSVQLAELEALLAEPSSPASDSIVVSAQGENRPAETVDKVFDGDLNSKWLDYADSGTNRASWLEWHYTARQDAAVINLDRLKAVQSPARARLALNLEGVVVSCQPKSNTIGFLDETGFQLLRVGSTPASVRPGERVRISGELRLSGLVPTVLSPEITGLGLLPVAALIPSQHSAELPQEFSFGTARGKATAISKERFYTTIALTMENGPERLLVRILNTGGLALPISLNCRLEVRGVVEPVFNENGVRVAGIIWVNSLDDVTLAAPTEKEWSELPEYSLAGILQSNLAPTQVVRVRGRVIEHKPGESLTLGQGTNQLLVYSKQPLTVATDSAVESVGLLSRHGGTPALHLAYSRPEGKGTNPDSAAEPASAGELQPVTQVEKIREFINAHPGKDFPVSLRGVITYVGLDLADFYLFDGVESIDVWSQFGAGVSPFQGQEGLYVQLNGVIHGGHLFPTEFAKVLGRGRMPQPLRHSWEYLMTGRDDGQWVEVEGVVSTVEKQRLTLTAGSGQLTAWVNDLGSISQGAFLGSLVRASGVCSPVFNNRNQRLGVRLLVPSCEYIQVVDAAPENPFDLPTLPIGSVMQTDADNSRHSTRLVKTTGIVTHSQPRMLFIQNEKDGLRVVPQQEVTLAPGDRVEVVGLAEPDGLSQRLVQALVRRVARDTLPQARVLELSGPEAKRQEEEADATRVQVEGILIDWGVKDSALVLQLQLEQSGRTFQAFLPADESLLAVIPPGSRVRLQGVFKARTEIGPDFDQRITSFEMYLNHAADVGVLARPAWWTSKRLVWLLSGVLGLSLLALGWGLLISRKNKLLQQAQGDLQVAHDKLELRVEERTHDLASSLSLLSATLESTADGILAVDQNGVVTSINSRFGKMWGLPPGLVESKDNQRLLSFVLPQLKDSDSFLGKIREVQANPEAESFDTLTLKDRRVFERYSQPQRLEGKSVGRVWCFRDITERKRAESELERAHKQLVETSRQVGMAEVATGVLHNVGNVLNSVNVSATLVNERLRRSPLDNLAKTAAMLDERIDDLPRFLTEDPKGKHFPTYLKALSSALTQEHLGVRAEVESLRKNIEHIKAIVAMQQSYARVGGALEELDPREMMEDAVQINYVAYEREQIQLAREYEPVPRILVDRHKVLQILVNLLSNARYALEQTPTDQRRVWLSILPGRAGHVSLRVRDNGTGIEPNNLNRIFNQGFTTRKNGHGFGLHSGANAAKAMNGALSVQSEGPGRGAAFTLELPVTRSSAARAPGQTEAMDLADAAGASLRS